MKGPMLLRPLALVLALPIAGYASAQPRHSYEYEAAELSSTVDMLQSDLMEITLDVASAAQVEPAPVVRVTPHKDINRVNTHIESGNCTVEISCGYINIQALLWDATIRSWQLGKPELLESYFHALIKDMALDQEIRRRGAQNPLPPLTFSRHTGDPERAGLDKARRHQLSMLFDALRKSTLAMCVAHELAHCQLGHVHSQHGTKHEERTSAKDDELDADEWAFNVMRSLCAEAPQYQPTLGAIGHLWMLRLVAAQAAYSTYAQIAEDRDRHTANEILKAMEGDVNLAVHGDLLKEAGIAEQYREAISTSIELIREAIGSDGPAAREPSANRLNFVHAGFSIVEPDPSFWDHREVPRAICTLAIPVPSDVYFMGGAPYGPFVQIARFPRDMVASSDFEQVLRADAKVNGIQIEKWRASIDRIRYDACFTMGSLKLRKLCMYIWNADVALKVEAVAMETQWNAVADRMEKIVSSVKLERMSSAGAHSIRVHEDE
ncbi:MAG: hypothetical protein H7A47_14945 [Verrucomicrobiales bacterium]|nr:hypothetical protein [Verrucomicrobiales bacterium]